ncbi:hypothetical protein F4556_003619 [Kitasatospora gansuensis]|uniref:Uncharacterized protein n=1 Tax=Kitasatospora gansuensis TaxID=258050 RepID=A0A7W7SCR6_9ACTN|nr:hypothetical protein [Kitasatospora gansuensis]MBB4948084.1 hypothetical protein [Kitasatospora gansuensis]
MPDNKKDPRSILDPELMGADTIGGSVRVFLLCARAARAESRGKPTAKFEARIDRIQEDARKRWNAPNDG